MTSARKYPWERHDGVPGYAAYAYSQSIHDHRVHLALHHIQQAAKFNQNAGYAAMMDVAVTFDPPRNWDPLEYRHLLYRSNMFLAKRLEQIGVFEKWEDVFGKIVDPSTNYEGHCWPGNKPTVENVDEWLAACLPPRTDNASKLKKLLQERASTMTGSKPADSCATEHSSHMRNHALSIETSSAKVPQTTAVPNPAEALTMQVTAEMNALKHAFQSLDYIFTLIKHCRSIATFLPEPTSREDTQDQAAYHLEQAQKSLANAQQCLSTLKVSLKDQSTPTSTDQTHADVPSSTDPRTAHINSNTADLKRAEAQLREAEARVQRLHRQMENVDESGSEEYRLRCELRIARTAVERARAVLKVAKIDLAVSKEGGMD